MAILNVLQGSETKRFNVREIKKGLITIKADEALKSLGSYNFHNAIFAFPAWSMFNFKPPVCNSGFLIKNLKPQAQSEKTLVK